VCARACVSSAATERASHRRPRRSSPVSIHSAADLHVRSSYYAFRSRPCTVIVPYNSFGSFVNGLVKSVWDVRRRVRLKNEKRRRAMLSAMNDLPDVQPPPPVSPAHSTGTITRRFSKGFQSCLKGTRDDFDVDVGQGNEGRPPSPSPM